MTLLSSVQNVMVEVGLTRPTSAATNTDELVKQVISLINREGKKLARDYEWQEIMVEQTFTTVAAEEQGEITTILGSDYHRLVNETMWNRTLNRPVPGPLSPTEWALLKSSSVTGPYPEYMIRDSKILFIPTPTAGETVALFYMSKNWAASSAGTGKAVMNADDDVMRLPEEVIELGVIWRFLKAKGFDYSEEFREYQAALIHATSKDGSKRSYDMGNQFTRNPGIFVPDGGFGS